MTNRIIAFVKQHVQQDWSPDDTKALADAMSDYPMYVAAAIKATTECSPDSPTRQEVAWAIEDSIELWRAKALLASRGDMRFYHISASFCPLCRMFTDRWCKGCPLYWYQKDSCDGMHELTAWHLTRDALTAYQDRDVGDQQEVLDLHSRLISACLRMIRALENTLELLCKGESDDREEIDGN